MCAVIKIMVVCIVQESVELALLIFRNGHSSLLLTVSCAGYTWLFKWLFGKKKKANCQDIMRHGNWLWAINSATGNWKNKSHIFSFSHRSITFHQQLISCHSRVSVRSHRNVLFFKGIFNLHKELCAFAVVYVFYKDFSEVLCFQSKRSSSSP